MPDIVDGIWDSYKRDALLDLRRPEDARDYPKLRSLNATETLKLIFARQIGSISKCKACKKTSTSDSKVKLCQYHWHRIQKLYFLFQEVHGFASDHPFEVTPKQHGPYLEAVDDILASGTSLDIWSGSKQAGSEHDFGPRENRIITNLISIYGHFNYNNIELLAARVFIDKHPEVKAEWNDFVHPDVEPQPRLKGIDEMLRSIETRNPSTSHDSKIIGFIETHFPSPEEWKTESTAVQTAVSALVSHTKNEFDLTGALPVGSSGILLVCDDKNLRGLDGASLKRVLKFPRPRGGTFRPGYLNTISEEISKMSTVIHPNVVRVLSAGEVEIEESTKLPWFTMEFIPGAENLRGFVANGPRRENLIAVLVDVARALDYIHSKGIVHCDIKDENVLVRPSNPPQGLLTDLGYAQVKFDDEKEIFVRFTDRTAHPFLKNRKTRESDPAAATAKILRKELSFDFDLYAYGKTLLDLLPLMEASEVLDGYDIKYLKLVILRLLRGYSPDRPVFQGMSESITGEIQYATSNDLLQDLMRLGI